MKAYKILHIDTEISTIAFQLFSKYSIRKSLRVPDLLIAATALRFGLKLYTDNKKDYSFIEGIEFYKEK